MRIRNFFLKKSSLLFSEPSFLFLIFLSPKEILKSKANIKKGVGGKGRKRRGEEVWIKVLRAGQKRASNMTIFLWFVFLASLLKHISCTSPRRAPESNARRYNRIQHGQCTYTFILPEQDGNCRETSSDQYNTNALQRDAPHMEPDFSSQKLQRLEHVMENYTQWLQKVSPSVWDCSDTCIDFCMMYHSDGDVMFATLINKEHPENCSL